MSVIDEKSGPTPSSYGNMPLEVSQSGSGPVGPTGPDGRTPNKFEEHGKKFGKKLGNAGMFFFVAAFYTLKSVSLTNALSNLRRWCDHWL